MAKDEQLYDQIEQYLDNSMPKDTRQSFEQQLEKDAELAAEVQLHRELDMAIDHFEADQAFRSNLKAIRANRQTPVRQMPRRSWLRIISVAAAVLVLVVALSYLFQQNQSPEQVAGAYLDLAPISLTEKSAGGETALIQAEKLYNQQEYAAASPLFDQYLQKHPDSFEVQLYAGIAHMMNDQYPNALSAFDTILDSDALNRAEAKWYKSICLVKAGQLEEAKKLLTELSQAGNSKWAKQAKKLLQELN